MKGRYKTNNKKIKELNEIKLEHFDFNDTLFIVSCTNKKIWDIETGVNKFVEAKKAYKGSRFIEFLNRIEIFRLEEKRYSWFILSGKYGFIEPSHPITRYNIYLGDPSSNGISDESLRKQTKQIRWKNESNTYKLLDFKKIICINCDDIYLEKISQSFPIDTIIYSFDFGKI